MRVSRIISAMLVLAVTGQATPPTASGSLNVEQVNRLGFAADDHFGVSIAGGGDFNGDGHDDWIVGAPYADVAANTSGAGYLFLGGSFASTAPVSILAGEVADDQAGISVAAGFNLNGDAYDDVAVGVRFHDGGAKDGGAVFIYFGRANPSANPTPDLKLFGEAADDWFGHSISKAGDVNNDGYDDLIIGAPYNDAAANAAGRAYIVFGAATPGAVTMRPINGAAQAHSHFGWSVGGGGDLNNDGYDDVVVGARLHGSGANGAAGRVYVFLGGNPFNTTPALIVEGETKNDWFGESVAVLGDINGDGFDDWIAGAHFRDPGGVSAAGEASVFLGGNPPSGARVLRIAGSNADAQAGKAVGSGGDMDGDSFADILVGEHFANTAGGQSAGQVLMVRGSSTPDNTIALKLSGNQANAHLGASVAAIGNLVSGSGQAIAAGSPRDSEAAPAAGQVTLVRASSGGTIDSFQSWAEGFGLVSADPLADDDGDGVANIGEYLFNTSPVDPNAKPVFETVLTDTEFIIKVPTPVNRPDAILGAQTSVDLIVWNSTHVTAMDEGFTVPRGEPRRFIRLSFTYQAP
jgi:hypothetical protein